MKLNFFVLKIKLLSLLPFIGTKILRRYWWVFAPPEVLGEIIGKPLRRAVFTKESTDKIFNVEYIEDYQI